MGISAFGKGNTFALTRTSLTEGAFGSYAVYTSPTYSWAFSKYGFNVSIDNEGMAFQILMDDEFPKPPPHMKPFRMSWDFLGIDRKGKIWKYNVGYTDKMEMELCSQFIYNDPESWWILNKEEIMDANDQRHVGFLLSNPSIEEINDFWKESHGGVQLEWFNIDEILITLNDAYPLKS